MVRISAARHRPWPGAPAHAPALDAVATWLTLRERHGGIPRGAAALTAAMRGSALLARLLDGAPPLPHPPPKRDGRAWYALVDEGHGVAREVREEHDLFGLRALVIDGDRWHAEVADDGYRAHHGSDPTLYAVRPAPAGTDWLIERLPV